MRTPRSTLLAFTLILLNAPPALASKTPPDCAQTLQPEPHSALQIPLPLGFQRPHNLGLFEAPRRHDIHTGIDLYCNPGDPVAAMESGRVVGIEVFTGPRATPRSPWWQETHAILVEGASGVLVYGEITPDGALKVGDAIQAGQHIGTVATVLSKNKGRPMTMLHLELLTHGARTTAPVWPTGTPRPATLLDPTELILPFLDDPRVLHKKLTQPGLISITDHVQSAVVRIRDTQGRILLLKRSDNDLTYPGSWCLPGGKVDAGETPEQAAQRETWEETGIAASHLTAVRVDPSDLLHRQRRYWIHSFDAQMPPGAQVQLSAEHSAYAWVTPNEARKLRLSGLVTYQLVFGK